MLLLVFTLIACKKIKTNGPVNPSSCSNCGVLSSREFNANYNVLNYRKFILESGVYT